MNIKGSLFDGAWFVAYRNASVPIFDEKGLKVPYLIIKNSLRYWCADPFLFFKNNTLYIFMEMYDTFKQKGVIGYRTIHDKKVSRLQICLETPYHLSYPYIFEKDGQIYMLPESYQSGKLTLYKAVSFPDKWETCEDVLTDKAVCDTDYICIAEEEYLLTTPVSGEQFVYDHLEMYRKENGKWKAYAKNPVVRDASHARNAGLIFEYNGKRYRPAQNCAEQYGENLIFHEITQLDQNGYSETKVSEVAIGDISIQRKHQKFSGIHTYNRSGEYEVVDVYCNSVFQPVRFLRLLMNKLKCFRGN